jgi:fluoride exporter
MRDVLFVGIGGFLGSVLRYWLSGVAGRWSESGFPVGTFIVNFLGCLAIGILWSLVDYRQWFSPEMRIFLTVGVLGGFTTFSAFGFETFLLLREQEYWQALANVAANVIVGVAAVFIGWAAVKGFAT